MPTEIEREIYMKNLQAVLKQPGQETAAGTQEAAQQTGRQLHLLFAATHTHQVTGYSKVAYNILKQLATIPWLKVTHFAFQKYNGVLSDKRPLPANIQQIDVSALDKTVPTGGFGFTVLGDVIKQQQPDIVFIYNDLSIIAQFIDSMKKQAVDRSAFKLWLYIDQVYTMQHMGYINLINTEADHIFTFTGGWKRCLEQQGVIRPPINVIKHGFDPLQFPKMPRKMIRQTVGIADDMFLIMSVNRNQPRKRLDLLIIAFVELLVRHPERNIGLMCVTDKGEKGGWWLFEIFVRELKLRGVDPSLYGSRLMVTSRDMIFTDDEINMFYNAADIGVSCAEGEGFGLCTFEQMGVGVPQIVPAIGGYTEYCNAANSLLIEPAWRYYLPTAQCPVGGEAHVVDPHTVCDAMEKYLLDPVLREAHGIAARDTVLGYTWEAAVSELKDALVTAKKN